MACVTQSYLPWGNAGVGAINSAVVIPSTAGQLLCVRFQQQCQATSYTKIGFRVGTGGAANSQCQVGIYSSDGTAVVRLGTIQTCDVSSTNKLSSSLTAYTLTAGTEYLFCAAASVTATLTLTGIPISISVLNVANDTVVTGPTTAAVRAQFNNTCTANTNPYACCTGSGTGTCTGLPSSTNTLTASAAAVLPFGVVAP